MLINLSNHPSEKWSARQLDAAVQYGSCIDWPFPPIDPQADEKNIETLATEYFNKLVAFKHKNTITVHIMGELTFCFSLIKKLQTVGIPCIASCSKRHVSEEEDGSKVVYFCFERFRLYN